MYRTSILACAVQAFVVAIAYAATVPPPTMPKVPRFVANPNSPYAATTAGQFAADCAHDQTSCAAIIGNVLMDRMQFSPTSHICLPGLAYGNAVAAWLQAHPETANMGVEDGVYLALSTIYKCRAPNNH